MAPIKTSIPCFINQHIASCTLNPEKITDVENLKKYFCHTFELFDYQGWLTAITILNDKPFSLDHVRQFYGNLTTPLPGFDSNKNYFVTRVDGNPLVVTIPLLEHVLGLDNHGVIYNENLCVDQDYPNYYAMLNVIFEENSNYHEKSAVQSLKVSYLFPRIDFNEIFRPDLMDNWHIETHEPFFMICIAKKIKLNIAALVLEHMKKVATDPTISFIPYAGIIKALVNYCKSPTYHPNSYTSYVCSAKFPIKMEFLEEGTGQS